MINPASFPNRVLLTVSGLTPQVITETLYALAVSAGPEERFIPTVIEVVTTQEGAKRIEEGVLHPRRGSFPKLCSDYELPEIRFSKAQIHCVTGPDGSPLTDIRTEDDNARMADAITERARLHTSDPNCALHVSLAGGRKTMGFYAGYALSLFGREQDRLSHVLVPDPYESSPEFWYPTPKRRIVKLRGNSGEADAKDATVRLAEIPFVRLRRALPPQFLRGYAGFAESVEAARAGVGPPRLEIRLAAGEIRADEQTIHLQPMQIALLAVLAQRAAKGKPPLPAPLRDVQDHEWAKEVLADLRMVPGFNKLRLGVEESLRQRCSGNEVSPVWSRLRKALREHLGEGRDHLYFDDGPTHRNKRYQVPLPPEAISFFD